MKKLLNMIALATISTSAIPTVGMVLNSNVVKNLSFKDSSATDNPFINKINGIKSYVTDVIKLSNGLIYACAEEGIYKSTDGINFSKILGSPIFGNTIKVNSKNTIWVGTNLGLYNSTDGENFNKVSTRFSISSLVIDKNDNIYLDDNGLWKSTDNGQNFNSIYLSESAGEVYSLVIDSQGIVWAGTSDGLYKSTDTTGTNFTKMSNLPKNIYSITFCNNLIYIGTDNGLYVSNDRINFNSVKGITGKIISLKLSNNGHLLVGTDNGLYVSNDRINFLLLTEINKKINSILVDNDGIVWVGTGGLYKINNLFNNLITSSQPDYFGPKYNGFVYNKEQYIYLKAQYLKSATLDTTTISVPSTQHITVGKHTLVLTLKDNYKQYADLFGGNTSTGTITYKFWVKTAIDTTTEFNYSTIIHDTDLLTGLVSNEGNTKNCPIIQTQQKSGSEVVSLTTTITSNMIDLNKSYYVQGTVDTTTNNFIENSSTKKPVPKDLAITTNGIYNLHLEDVVGNTYDSYLELGQSNWKLKGDFDDQQLKHLEAQLNVTVSVSSPVDKQIAMGWLQNYQRDVANAVSKTVSDIGKGFDIDIKPEQYKDFLDHVDYTTTSHHEAINQDKLNQMIINLANQMLKDGLNKLPKDLNVDTSNVVDSNTLNSYSSWITGYQDFINKNKNQWFKKVCDVASRGFADQQQIQQIEIYLNGLTFRNYLQHVKWSPTVGFGTNNDYKQFIMLDKLQADTIAWVNRNIPAVNQAYQNAIKQAESGLNMHGYKLSDLMGDNQLPQTKSQIDNYKDGLSFNDWLQQQADGYYHTWQLKMGLAIGLPLLALASFAGLVLYWKFSYKHNPIRRADKTFKPRTPKNLKSKKSEE